MVIFKNVSGWSALPAETALAMQWSADTRFATYYPILQFSKINISWTKDHFISIPRLKFSYFFIKYLVLFQ